MNKKMQEDNLIPWIGRTAKKMEYFITNYLQERGFNITKEQWILMFHISMHGETQQNNLACLSNRDKTSLTRIINTLEKKGLVVRIAAEQDKRSKLIQLTKEGKTLLDETKHLLDEIKQHLTQGISEQDTKLAIEILKKVQENIDPDICCCKKKHS